MRISRSIFDFLFSFVSVFIVSCLVTMIWNVAFHAKNGPDWGTAAWLGILMGTVYVLTGAKDRCRE